MEESQTAGKRGGEGGALGGGHRGGGGSLKLFCSPQWSLGALPLVGVGGQSPLKLEAFSKMKGMKNPFSNTLSCFKQPLTKYSLLCFKAFFQRKKNRLPQRSNSKDSILIT